MGSVLGQGYMRAQVCGTARVYTCTDVGLRRVCPQIYTWMHEDIPRGVARHGALGVVCVQVRVHRGVCWDVCLEAGV